MDKYTAIFAIQAVLIFIAVYGILYAVFCDTSGKGKIKINKSIYSTLDKKTIFLIILAASGATYFMSFLSGGVITRVVIFVTVFSLAPYFLKNNADRIKAEDLYNDVIIYCSNMEVLLKQYRNVYSCLDKVKDDVGWELRGDIEILRASLDEGKEATREVMRDFEKKYQYTCINSLNIILYHMKYEDSATMPKEMFSTFAKEIASLQQDMKKNKMKRSSMRITYFGLTIGGYLMYLYFFNSLKGTSLAGIYDNTTFRAITLVYDFLMIVSLYFTDRLFCTRLFQE